MKGRYALAALLMFQLVGVSSAQAQGRRRPNVITREEIEQSPATNAFDLIRQLRPAWLRTRGATSMRDPASGGLRFYLDGVALGSVEDVEAINSERISEMRYLNASDATTKYGTGHTSGAVEITSRR